MRIGFYTPSYPGLTGEGGIGSYTRSLAHNLASLGHEALVLAPGNFPATSDGSVRIHSTRTDHLLGIDRLVPGAGACWRVAKAMCRLVREQGLDIVEFPNWEGYGLLFRKLTHTPIVVRLHTSSKEAQSIDRTPVTRWHKWNVLRERWVARKADALVTHSIAHRRLMVDELGVATECIQLIPHGIETFPDWRRPAREPGPPTVVYLGRLEHRKGTVELLQSIPQVLRAVPDARFILIGADRPHCPGGRFHAQYLEQEFPSEVRRHVTLAGRLPQPEVDRWLQTADVFVAPSRYESFGLIFIEAMRWGTPVIGTTAGGIPEIVDNGKTGLLVSPEAPDQLAGAIIQLLANSEHRTALGTAGRQKVESEFSAERMTRRMVEVYEEVIQARTIARGRQPEKTYVF